MIRNVAKLKIDNDQFFGSTTLDLFPSEDISINYIYGKNGSGKTTLSNLLIDVSNKSPNVNFLDGSGLEISLTDKELQNIHVFNEKYIDNNVKVSGDKDGMNAILLFGEAADIDEKIQIAKDAIEHENDAIRKRRIEDYHDANSTKSIDNVFANIKLMLQNNWATRQQSIKKNKNKSPVAENTIYSIIGIDVSKAKMTELKKEYSELYNSIKNINSDSEKMNLLSVDFNSIDEKELINTLNTAYDKKIANSLSKKIIDITSPSGKIEDLKNIVSGDRRICPVCLQPLSKEYVEELKNAFDDAFDSITKNAIKNLETYDVRNLQVDALQYSILCGDKIISDLNNLISQYNSTVEKYKYLIQEKTQNIYDSVGTACLGLDEKKDEINEIINKINESVKKHNDVIDNYKKNVDKLTSLNNIISACEASALIIQYKKLINEMEIAEQENKKSLDIINNKEKEIRELNLQKRNYDVAKKEINKELAIIFSSKNKLRLEEGEDPSKYYVYSNRKKVKLNKLSTGERNIIALCYFFEELKNNCKVNNYFTEEELVVIDDPISSFDYENKLSVFEYLSKMVGQVFNGNKNSKLIIMSHERSAIYAMNNINGKRLNNIVKPATSRLVNKTISKLSINKNSNYCDLMNEAFEFAMSNPDSEVFDSKGNEIRKMLEAYSTFNYKKGIDELFGDEEVLKKVKDDELREFFRQSLSSIVINFESHTEQITKQYPDLLSFDMFSEDEQIKDTRIILAFLYSIDSYHVKQYLGNQTEHIESWIKDIKNLIQTNNKNED